MKVVLGKFARSGIETQLGTDLAVSVQAALTHYTRRLKSTWAPLAPPLFRKSQAADDPAEPFDLTVEAEVEAALETEARRHEVPVQEILAHAVLTYLADLDSTATADESIFPGHLPERKPAGRRDLALGAGAGTGEPGVRD